MVHPYSGYNAAVVKIVVEVSLWKDLQTISSEPRDKVLGIKLCVLHSRILYVHLNVYKHVYLIQAAYEDWNFFVFILFHTCFHASFIPELVFYVPYFTIYNEHTQFGPNFQEKNFSF